MSGNCISSDVISVIRSWLGGTCMVRLSGELEQSKDHRDVSVSLDGTWTAELVRQKGTQKIGYTNFDLSVLIFGLCRCSYLSRKVRSGLTDWLTDWLTHVMKCCSVLYSTGCLAVWCSWQLSISKTKIADLQTSGRWGMSEEFMLEVVRLIIEGSLA